jgi:hypothetical protein
MTDGERMVRGVLYRGRHCFEQCIRGDEAEDGDDTNKGRHLTISPQHRVHHLCQKHQGTSVLIGSPRLSKASWSLKIGKTKVWS